MKGINYIDSKGNNINISLIGYFSIPELQKEYIIYSLLDDDNDNDNGFVVLGEVVKTDDNVQILGLLPEEKDLVVAYYNEIANQLGGPKNE